MSICELTQMCVQTTKDDEAPAKPPICLEEGNLKEPNIDEVLFRELVFGSPAYQWLIATLQREFYVSAAEQDVMAQIRSTVLQYLPSQHISGKTSSNSYMVGFHLNWDPLNFSVEQEAGIPLEKALLRVLTLTATSGSHVQCIPCLNYLRQVWPFTSTRFVKFISDILRNPSRIHKCKVPSLTTSSDSLYRVATMLTLNGR
jgi:hypothetical protein